MQIKCPACQKINENNDACDRCKCDLTGLRRLSMAAQMRLAAGSEALRHGNGHDALSHAVASWRLKKSEAAAKLAFLSCLLLKDFEQATTWGVEATSRNRRK